ncbi:MAG: DUF4097 family beta strand repeat-containing protein [Haloferacaceae archaeon]
MDTPRGDWPGTGTGTGSETGTGRRIGDGNRRRPFVGDGSASRRRFLAGVSGAGVAAASGCLGLGLPWRGENGDGERGEPEATASWTEAYEPPGGGRVVVENLEGPVRIRGEDRGTIEVGVRKRSWDGETPLERTVVNAGVADGVFAVRTDHRGTSGETPATVEVDVSVPRTYPVARASTTNGDVVATDTRGNLSARTVNGSLEVTGVRGFVGLEATNGDLDVRGTTGIDDLTVSNGHVDADVRAIRSDTLVRTANGDVDLRLGPGLDATVRAEAVNGRVEVGEGLSLADATVASRRVTGRLGEGKRDLRAETSTGQITLSSL